MQFNEFNHSINAIFEKSHKWNNLEDFLRSMWGEILKNQDNPITWAILIDIISDAWTNEPLEFDEKWLDIIQSADDIEIERDVTLPDFEYLRGTILFQIADLRRMRDAGYFELDGNILFMGKQSPTGAIWYNWTPQDFLTCGIGGIGDHQGDDNLPDATWRNLAELLYLGQMYE